MFENKYIHQLKIITYTAAAIYIAYLIILSFALITHTQALSSIIILATLTLGITYYFSLKFKLHPISAILSVYLFQALNLLTLNSRYALSLFLDNYNLGFAAFLFEPWLLLLAAFPSIIGYRKYVDAHPQRKKITYEEK